MKMPWTNTTGLAKAVAILASGLVICLGLCGLNFVAVVSGVGIAGSILGLTAYLELAGMIICAAGLVAVLIIALAQGSYRQFFGRTEFSKLDLQKSNPEDSLDPPSDEAQEK